MNNFKCLLVLAISLLVLESCDGDDGKRGPQEEPTDFPTNNPGPTTPTIPQTGQPSTTDHNKVLLKTNDVTYYTVNFIGDRMDDAEVEKYEYTYDGLKIKQMVYSTTGGEQSWGTDYSYYTYYYTGNLITKIIEAINPDPKDRTKGKVNFTSNFKYQDGKLIQYDRSMDTHLFTEYYTYNANGTISVRRISGSNEERTVSDFLIVLNNEGHAVEFQTDGRTVKNRQYTYDDKYNPLKNIIGFKEIAFVGAETQGFVRNVLTNNEGLILWYRAFYGNEEYFAYDKLGFPIFTQFVERKGNYSTGMLHAEAKYSYY